MIEYGFTVQDLEYFLLVFVRIASFFFSAPFFSTRNVPRRTKVVIAFAISLMLFRFVLIRSVIEYNTIIGFAILVLKEAACGLCIGLAGYLALYIMQHAGSLIDMDIGLAMAQMFDPLNNMNMGFSGMIYQYAFLLIMTGLNLHHNILRTFISSYESIPIGNITFHAESLTNLIIRYVTTAFMTAFQIFLPVFAGMLLLNVVLGTLAKVAPQMNMFVIGVQLKIFVGFGILFIMTNFLSYFADLLYGLIDEMMTSMIASFV